MTVPAEPYMCEAAVGAKYYSPLRAAESRRYAGTLRLLLRALDGEIVTTALIGESESDLLGTVGQKVDCVREFLDGRVVMPAQPSDLRCRALAVLDRFANEFEARAGHGSPSAGVSGQERRDASALIVGDDPGAASLTAPGATPGEAVPAGGGNVTATGVDLFACVAHPEGSVGPCASCATVRRRQEAWLQRHDTPMRGAAHVSFRGRDGRISDVFVGGVKRRRPVAPEHRTTQGALAGVVLARFADDQGHTRENGNPRLDAAFECDRHGAGSARRVALSQRFVHEVVPVAVVSPRVEVEDGPVIVQLDAHGRKRTARRVLAGAAAVAALVVWAVAS